MIKQLFIAFSITLMTSYLLNAQVNVIKPNLSEIDTTKNWRLHNREIEFNNNVYLDSKQGDGLLWLSDCDFKNGSIEADIKGKNDKGRSFVGIAFHGKNDSVYDAIYFRPFNFINPHKVSKGIQYISMPDFPWYVLREKFPRIYEDSMLLVPDPNDWFHVRVEIIDENIEVFVNNYHMPCLSVKKLNNNQSGFVGFWVGNNSEGWFRNLKIETYP